MKQNGGQWFWLRYGRAKGNPQNYPKSTKDCIGTASSLSSSQRSRLLLVFLLFFFFVIFTRYLFTRLPVRHVWTKARSQLFWEEKCLVWNERDWVDNFLISMPKNRTAKCRKIQETKIGCTFHKFAILKGQERFQITFNRFQ